MFRITAILVLSGMTSLTWSQCPLVGHAPAFQFDVPEGVHVDSAFLLVSSYESSEPYYMSSATASQHDKFETPIIDGFESSGYVILDQPLEGPDTADYQVISGLVIGCFEPGTRLEFDWCVKLYCSGTSGPNINYSGPYSDDRNQPTLLGSVYSGENIISGEIDNTLQGGVYVYPDGDFDGYGSQFNSVLVCYRPIVCWGLSLNSLDCDDTNAAINPGAEEIPNNGIDENCDGSDLVTSLHYVEDVKINVYPNPATTVLNISVDGHLIFRASLFDVTGKLLYAGENPSSIPLGELPDGIYVLDIQDLSSGNRIIERIVKGS